jgi:hypothetical protein
VKIDHLDPPGNVLSDLSDDSTLPNQWSQTLSANFDQSITAVTAFLNNNGGGTCQFYNPVTNGSTAPDLPHALGDITWNGFPKRFSPTGPGHPTRFAEAEPDRNTGQARLQDEYLEWFVNRNDAGKITSIHFTCEAWDYFEFLGAAARSKLVSLYQQFISPAVTEQDLLKPDGSYDRKNKWNTASGAMHLTHSANNLFAEVFLAASATVRRQQNSAELSSSNSLINCAQYGDAARNSDPNIGFAVNGLARDGRMITLANPVGLYMSAFDGAGLTLNGEPAGAFFTVVRGAFPLALRAVYQLPEDLAAAGLTVSDVKIGGSNLEFGGQLAERITMHLIGVASVAQTVNNAPVGCGPIPDASSAPAPAAALRSRPAMPSRRP